MTIRDRGKVKWQFAFGMPELIKAQRDLWRDSERVEKPLLDVYELDEFDQRIAYAMAYKLTVRLSVWDDGFTSEMTGTINPVDPITHELRIEVEPGVFEPVAFDSVVRVKVVD
ncbi:YolD-like family protein [Bacillus sp. sid0103]|uniref:YolD-like family protein n=1 Tax=Bacillus sp. sid0103 TaxID=2856337 RepID=UPI001C47A33B|nr:YolD-like family protein [Bacillus sp. sid0103]MBV7507406.1 YolD-like family protein [Bacillus sp. sid0103]